MPSAIALTNLTLGYDRHPAVHHLSGAVRSGALLAIAGPNGAGKSTLLKGIAGSLRPIGGAVTIDPAVRKRIAYLPQAADVDRSFPILIHEFVAMGAWRRIGLFGGLSRAVRLEIEHALEAVGLAGFERRTIGTLSGGQMQRVLFARLLLQDAPVILLDEPFTAIDESTTTDLVALVRRWHGEGRTVIAVLHDMPLIRAHFPQTLLLAREVVAWGTTGDALSDDNLARARRMVEAFDSHAHICDRAA